MKEYGGYIELEYNHGPVYHPGAVALNSGRHALVCLLAAKGLKKLYIPKFLCRSVPDTCRSLGVEVEFYSVDRMFHPVFSHVCQGKEALYVVNYYGQLSNAYLTQLQQRHGNLIVDHAQDFFREPLPGVDTLYTCRKFFGVADGGYLYTDAAVPEDLEQDISYDRMTFLMGRLEKTASEFYGQYSANNRRFAQEPVKRMSRLTENLLRGIDYQRVKDTRTQNFAALHRALQEQNPLKLTVPDGAFMYPLYHPNGAELRRKLQQKKIYIPTLWPDVFELCKEDETEYDMANNILPLPVDQRYGIMDMRILVNEVTKCIN